MTVVDLVIAGLIALGGIRSLGRWLATDFPARSIGERLLYTTHVTARVGLWFAFAGVFAGFAVLDEPQRFGWYLFVLLGLAGVQLLTGLVLARSPSGSAPGGPGAGRRSPRAARAGVPPSGPGNALPMPSDEPGTSTPEPGVGPLEPDKRGESSEPGWPQPQAAEVESARLLANQAGGVLAAEGFTPERLRSLADEFIALDRGEDLDAFVRWARVRGPRP